MRTVGVGIAGFGTVGAGVADALTRHAARLRERLGFDLALRGVADLDIDRDRGVAIDRALLGRDAMALVQDPAVDIVVELIGGCGDALAVIRSALRCGKPVVTANKKLLAEHGAELFDLAAECGLELYFGASVGGGIPIIRAVRDGLIGNRCARILGILNGTCNFILTRMETSGISFQAALAEAQRAGYAESDPALDIDGLDTAHKAAILCALAHGIHPAMDTIAVEGIRGLAGMDVQFASEMGYRIKLLAVIKRDAEAIELRVQPTLIPLGHVLASVNDVFNAIMVRGDLSGETLYYGRGAGRDPTASTVIADLAEAARMRAAPAARRPRAIAAAPSPRPLLVPDRVRSRYYLRLSVLDRAGSFARIAGILGACGVSIASVMQKDEKQEGRHVPVVVLTHEAQAAWIRAALQEIAALEIIDAPPVRYPIEG